MLDTVLKFFAGEINDFLQAKTGVVSGDVVTLSAIVDEDGKYSLADDTVGINIINIEEESTFKDQLPEYTYQNGQHLVLQPKLKLNLFVMFAAHFGRYEQALKHISYVLTYFQSHRFFVPDEYPELSGTTIERLVVELQRLNYDQLNQIWAYVGAKQLPSVVYKIRLVAIQDQIQTKVQRPVTSIETQAKGMT